MQYSRLSKRYDRLSKRQAYLLLGISFLLLFLFVIFGFPAILNLASTVSTFRRDKAVTVEKGIAPAIPKLFEDFEATKSATVNLRGIADPNVALELYQDNEVIETGVADDEGEFSFDVSLNKGDNVFSVVAVSASGVKSDKSKSYKLTYVSSPPKLEIASPKDGETVKEDRINITGTIDADVTVLVNDRLAISTNERFSYNLQLSSGDNKIKIVATDQAGNQTSKEITVKYNP